MYTIEHVPFTLTSTSMQSPYQIDYDIMHHYFSHPFKEVLKYAQNVTFCPYSFLTLDLSFLFP